MSISSSIDLQNYFEKREFTALRVVIYYLNARHEGKGFVSWDYQSGFRLDAVVRNTIGDLPAINDVLKSEDSKYLYARPRVITSRGEILVLPRMFIGNPIAFFEEGIIRGTSTYGILSERSTHLTSGKDRGEVFFSTAYNTFLSDSIELEKSFCSDLGQERILKSGSHASSIVLDRPGIRIRGEKLSDSLVKIRWSTKKTEFSRIYRSRIARSFLYSLSLLTSQNLSLRCFRVDDSRREKQYFFETFSPFLLNICSPYPQRNQRLDKGTFFRIFDHCAKASPEGVICKGIIDQLVCAEKQPSFAAQELLVSTILEAFLRKYYNFPFQDKKSKSKKNGNLKFSIPLCIQKILLKDLRLSTSQRETLKIAIMKLYSKLRNRNAHPDWFQVEKSQSFGHSENRIKEIQKLARIYGYLLFLIMDISPDAYSLDFLQSL